MSLEQDVRYLLDRIEIQEKVSLYGLGQDLHQAGAANKNILDEWNELFTPDATIDVSAAGFKIFPLREYAELMRGKEMKGGGLEVNFKTWQHIEGLTRVTIDGDTAQSLSFYFHTHEARDVKANLIIPVTGTTTGFVPRRAGVSRSAATSRSIRTPTRPSKGLTFSDGIFDSVQHTDIRNFTTN